VLCTKEILLNLILGDLKQIVLCYALQIWNISSPESKITLSDHPDSLLCVHGYTIDMRQYLIAGSWDGTAQV
jgi:hypothetical protein